MYSTLFFVFLLWFLLQKHVQCKRLKRIVAAYDAEIASYPYMVSLLDWSSESYHSEYTGILITPEWLLTDSYPVEHNRDPTNFKIISGRNGQSPNENETINNKYVKHVNLNNDHYSVDLTAVHFKPALPTDNPKIQPAKIPPRKDFLKGCPRVEIVGWGSKIRTHDLTMVPAKKALCEEGTELNLFCLHLYGTRHAFCDDYDKGMAVVCNGTLIGVTWKMYMGPKTEEGVQTGCEKYLQAIDIAQYMTWLHATTGVKIPYASKPNYTPLKYSKEQKKEKEKEEEEIQEKEQRREMRRKKELGIWREEDDDEASTPSLGYNFRNTPYMLWQSGVCFLFIFYFY